MFKLEAELAPVVTSRKSAKGQAREIAGEVPENNKPLPLPERELITVPRAENWELEVALDYKVMAMLARRENRRQSIDHRNLGLVPADGDDVAQHAIELAQAMKAVRTMLNHGADELWETVRIAELNLWGDSSEELEQELADLSQERWAFDAKTRRVRTVHYKRATKQAEQAIADKFSKEQQAQFVESMKQVQTFTYGELLLALKLSHNYLNRQAMNMVRGLTQFGKQVEFDTWQTLEGLFNVTSVEETEFDRYRVILSRAFNKKLKRGQALSDGLRMACALAGLQPAMKKGKYQFDKQGNLKLTACKRETFSDIEKEEGKKFITKSKQALFAFFEVTETPSEAERTAPAPRSANMVFTRPMGTSSRAKKAQRAFDSYINSLRADTNTVALAS